MNWYVAEAHLACIWRGRRRPVRRWSSEVASVWAWTAYRRRPAAGRRHSDSSAARSSASASDGSARSSTRPARFRTRTGRRWRRRGRFEAPPAFRFRFQPEKCGSSPTRSPTWSLPCPRAPFRVVRTPTGKFEDRIQTSSCQYQKLSCQ